jgi:Spy/CpxP family protein refolding chaperone
MRLHFALLSATVLAIAPFTAMAQAPASDGGPGRQGFAERRMQTLLKDITLTTEQQAKVDSIRTRYRAQLPTVAPYSTPDSATRRQLRDLNRRQQEEIRAVLTAEQQQVWDRNVAEMRARRPGGS